MLKRLVSLKKSDLIESYVMVMLTVGLPLIALIYGDWRSALSTFVVTQIILGFLAIKTDKTTEE
jgi:hypothetical protein